MDIKKKIKERGFSLSQVAEMIGVSQPTLSKVLSGNPSLSRLVEVANAIGISVSELLSDEDSVNCVCPHCKKHISIRIQG